MQTPFRTEADAFRFGLLTVAAFTAIAIAGLAGGFWAALVVWAVLTAVVVGFYLFHRQARAVEKVVPAPHSAAEPSHVLVVAHPGSEAAAVVGQVHSAIAGSRADVLVVCPAQMSRLDHWVSAVDKGRDAAQARLDAILAGLAGVGIDARGEVGDEDAIHAIEDAVRTFGADLIVVASPTREYVDAAGHEVVGETREHFDVPVRHVVTGA